MPAHTYVQSVLRALDILELVGNTGNEGVALHYVAHSLDLHRQTVRNLLKSMVHKEFLEKIPSPSVPRYRLGPVMKALRESQVRWMQDFLLPSIPRAIRISRRMRADVIVSQCAAGRIVGRFVSRGEESEMPTLLGGCRMATYGSTLAFQAFMEPASLVDYRARHPLDGDSLEYWKSFELLDGLLAQVRLEGYVAFVKIAIFRAAAPIFRRDKTPAALISLTKPYEQMKTGDAQECIDLVRQAADELSHALRQKVNAEPSGKDGDATTARS